MRRCEVCQSEIPEKALKCTKCNGYQDSWRRLLFGEHVATLTSLIPVLALAGAFISTQLKAVGADVKIFDIDCRSKQKLSVTASNIGNRDAVLEPVNLELQIDGSTTHTYKLTVDGLSPKHVLIPTGKITSFDVLPKDTTSFAIETGDAKCAYKVNFKIVEFDAASAPDDFDCPCASG